MCIRFVLESGSGSCYMQVAAFQRLLLCSGPSCVEIELSVIHRWLLYSVCTVDRCYCNFALFGMECYGTEHNTYTPH
jgi:hypothetical protein